MSSSSSRKGRCLPCGHRMTEHAGARESRCKKCKKVFDICSAHGLEDSLNGGWRICHVPCSCGERYYPDKARGVKVLEPHEHVSTHPGYRALEDPFPGGGMAKGADGSGETDVKDGTADLTPKGGTPNKTRAPSSTSHQRTTSENSLDPLQWSPGRITRETSTTADLTQRLNQVRLDDVPSRLYTETRSRGTGR